VPRSDENGADIGWPQALRRERPLEHVLGHRYHVREAHRRHPGRRTAVGRCDPLILVALNYDRLRLERYRFATAVARVNPEAVVEEIEVDLKAAPAVRDG
jgi:hypothetical protein